MGKEFGETDMSSRTRVITTTYLPKGNSNNIATDTSTYSNGGSPLEKEIAGHTAGMVGQGNAIAHSKYMAEKGNDVIYRRGLVD
jgi:hypothetical protein